MNCPVVMKFGGASLGCAESILRVARLIQQQQKHTRVIVIVSGCGNVTNDLETILADPHKPSQKRALEQVKLFHSELLRQCALTLQAEPELTATQHVIYDLCDHALELLDYPEVAHDDLLTLGERLSAQIMIGVLRVLGLSCGYLDAAEFIHLCGEKSEHQPAIEKISRLLQQVARQAKHVNVSEGFIARAEDGQIATLGRNGSDTTAAIWAVALNASRLEIWKEVKGLCNADPNIIPEANLITDIAFDDLCVLSQFGASVIHYPALQLLRQQRLILSLKCPKNPNTPKATHIHFGGERPPVSALALLSGVQVLPHGEHLGLFCVDKGAAELRFIMELFLQNKILHALQKIQKSQSLLLLTLFSNQFAIDTQALKSQLSKHGISVLAVCSDGANECVNLVIVAEEKAQAMRIAHAQLRQQITQSQCIEVNDAV
ncbi:hypothetical protein J8Z24_18920 [Pseudoalteromonas sp. SCSIO 43201]|uniref:amino acid kinase family protein n=1 Tax=Pseudoalteromonas sp. SCSIO 43201 TaxID=2822842 RepID=UPI0020756D92|nr:hypothetical protein [Pseudoalteromonas sp. SCSIO 43201]USD31031.1 hypothetical protein J8Z24_18920 [Pseudoalteromonas sp. SCSIO 43201]